MLHLPRILDNVSYTFTADGVSETSSTRVAVRVDKSNSYYRGESLADIDSYMARKIENLFIMAYPKHHVDVHFV